MNGQQIYSILSKDPITAFQFQGVFAVDTIPFLEENQAIVVNTDESSQPGAHWLALYMNDSKVLEFFDSYGHSPEFYGLHIPNACWNSISFQSFTSNVCGAYCIYFLYKRCQGFSMYSIINDLHVNKRNDFKMHQFVKKKYGVRLVFKK